MTADLPLLRILLLVVLCCLSAANAAAAAIGTVTYLSGAARILSVDGKTRPILKGSIFNPGDMVITGSKSQVDIHFSDESLFQLRPETQFRIDEYTFNGKPDGNEKGIFNLLKGGFRTITGLIGRHNKNAYAVVTPTATIGVRGTEYTAALDNGLRVNVARGEITLGNNAGTFIVSEGQSAYISRSDAAPIYLQSGGTSQGGGSHSGPNANVQITGNTRIEANTSGTKAIAAGQGNTATNQAGVIGGQ